MNILVLNYEYPPLGGGAGQVCKQLAENFVARGHRVELITMGYRGLPQREEQNGVTITRVPALRRCMATCETHEMLSFVVSAYPRMLWRLRRGDFDVIHCHFIVPTGLLAWQVTRLARVPYVLTAHGSDVPGYNPDRFTREHRIMTPLLRRIVSAASAVVAPSRYLRDLIRKNIGPYEIEDIPNGIDVARMAPGAKRLRLLMTGRLLPRKGFQHVLLALEGLELPPDLEVHIVGDGPMRRELETLAGRVKAPVVFHGWLENDSPVLRELYERSSIFCLPSERENASISLLEAMLAGMAVVTSDVSGCPETVGEAGLLVPAGDVQRLREVLGRLIASPETRETLGRLARKRVLEHYDWNPIVRDYLACLQGVVRYDTQRDLSRTRTT